jgi:hypothetical protein
VRIVRTALAFLGAIVGAVVATPVFVVAAFFRSIAFLTNRLAALLEPPFYTGHQIIQPYAIVGWKMRPNVDGYASGPDGLFHMTTDSEGWRGKTRLADSDLVVFGDSHAFGEGTDDAGYFGNLCREVRVKAIGANGYNTVQELLWIRELAPQLRNKVVLWLIFYGNDLLDNL